MPITCICPQCQKTLAIGDEFAGQAMRCPLCMALFQAPPMTPQNVPSGAAPGSEPAPPWLNANNGPQIPYGPAWGGINETRQRRDAGPVAPEFNSVAAGTPRLAAGWHMVRRGLSLMPLSLLLVFGVLGIASILLMFTSPGTTATEIVQLLSLPIAVVGSVLMVLSAAMCCLVPDQPLARKLAMGASGCLLGYLIVGLFTLGVMVLMKPADRPANSTALAALLSLAFLPTMILFLAGCVLFLLFLRQIALFFQNRRLALATIWCALFLAASPFLLLFMVLLLRLSSRVVGGDGTGLAILVTLVIYLTMAVDLVWLLHVIRDVRRVVLRAFVAMTA